MPLTTTFWPSLAVCSWRSLERRTTLLTCLGEHAVPGHTPLQKACLRSWFSPCAWSLPILSGSWVLGSPELWETLCCFSPRLLLWLESNGVITVEGRENSGDIWSLD